MDAEHEVGSGYKSAVLLVYGLGADVSDLQMHAAEERLKCYRYLGAKIPPYGGKPVLIPRVASGSEIDCWKLVGLRSHRAIARIVISNCQQLGNVTCATELSA